MPKFVQQVTGKGYSLIEPKLEWARGKAPLLNGAVAKLETYVPPVVQTADKYIDMTSEGVAKKAAGIRSSVEGIQTSVAVRVAPVQTKVIDVKNTAVSKVVDVRDNAVMKVEVVVCFLETLIDRFLPPPAALTDVAEKKGTEEEQAKAAILPRIAHLPFRVPLRVTMIVYVKASGAVDAVVVSGRRVKSLAWEKQVQVAQIVAQRTKPFTDKVSSLSAPVVNGLQKRKAAAYGAMESGQQAIVVKVYVIGEKFHLVEMRDWSSRKVDGMWQGATTAARGSARIAHTVTVRVAGEQRAAFVFTKIGERMPSLNLDIADATPAPKIIATEEKTPEQTATEEKPGPIAG